MFALAGSLAYLNSVQKLALTGNCSGERAMEQSTHVTWYLSKGLHTPNMDLWIMIQGRKAEANIFDVSCYCQKALTQYLLAVMGNIS